MRPSLGMLWLAVAILFGSPEFTPAQRAAAQTDPSQSAFKFTFDPHTPLHELLPAPPKSSGLAGTLIPQDFDDVPEVQLMEPITGNVKEQMAHQAAKINFVNQRRPDHFVELLMQNRSDLAGLPFIMGDACRQPKEQAQWFFGSLKTVRQALDGAKRADDGGPGFRESYKTLLASDGPTSADRDAMRAAALMQLLATEGQDPGLGMVRHLAALQGKPASEALARLAIFSDHEVVRWYALAMLEKRDRHHVTDVLRRGLTYPWPSVASRTAKAIVKLQCRDFLPDLVDLLDKPDPRAPAPRVINGKQVTVVRELVRVNHLRNCLLCHPPGNTGAVQESTDIVFGAAPLPGQPLPPSSFGYNPTTSPDVLVRADITYLRQDFSRLHKVKQAAPWPEMQRFDYLVRTRTLEDNEARAYQAHFGGKQDSPYQTAALMALRELTGLEHGPSAAAWRDSLGLRWNRTPRPGE